MRGRVLGFDSGTGAIVTSDGVRFGFEIRNWRDECPPARGLPVDFIVRDGTADEIYLALEPEGAARDPHTSVPQTAVDIPAAPPEAAYAFRGNVAALVFAALIPISFFLPWFSVPGLSVSNWDLLSSVSLADFVPDLSSDPRFYPRIFAVIPYLMCAVPAYAAWLIIQELRGASTPRLRTRVGAISLAAALSNLLLVWHFASYFARESGSSVNVSSILSIFGIGWIMLILLSVGLVAVGCGWPPFPRREDAELETSPATYGPSDSETTELAQDESWVYVGEEREERFGRGTLLTHALVGTHIVALICFLLPWIALSGIRARVPAFSEGTDRVESMIGSVNGFDLISGSATATSRSGTNWELNYVFAGSVIVTITALVLILASLIMTIMWEGRKLKFAVVPACGGAVALLLWEALVQFPSSVAARFAPAPIQTDTQIGFWPMILALVAAMIISWGIGRAGEESD